MQEENQNNQDHKYSLKPVQLAEGATLPVAASAVDARQEYPYGRATLPDGRQMHLRDYWRIIRRRLWVPLSVVFVVVTLMTVLMLRSPSIYEGRTTVQIDNEQSSTFTLKELRFSSEDTLYINTQLKNLLNPRIAYHVAKTLDLEHNASFEPRRRKNFFGKPQALQVTAIRDEEQAEMDRLADYIEELMNEVEVARLRDTRLVEIRYRHRDRELAKKITDTWADVFIREDLATRTRSNKNSDQFLDERIASVKLELRNAEEKLLNYRRTNQVIDFGEKESTVIARLSGLNQALLEAENERKSLEGFYQLAQSADPSTIPEVQNSEYIRDLNKKLTELRQRRQELGVVFTSEWPDMKKIDQQITEVEGELRAAHQRIIGSINNKYLAARQREESIRRALSEQRTETLRSNEGAIQAKIFQQDVDTNRRLLDNLLQSKKELEVTNASLALKTNIRVTHYSALPRIPVAPRRVQNILIAFALSLLAGLGLAVFLDYLNNKIETVEDIDRYLGLPALGVIPVCTGAKGRKLLAGAQNGSKELSPASLNASLQSGNVILTQVEASSSLAESYRQLRTAVMLSSAEHAPRTILVTSSQPTEGKTTTSVNLAISLAQTGASVLLVDADLRRPRAHKIFNLKNSRGSCNYLAGDSDLSSLIQTALPNLYVLPAGPLPPNPAELLGSQRMRQMIETLTHNFDYVVIDSPPVASFADGLILSSLVEGVIMVVKAGVTSREMAQRTRANLQSVGARVLGVVVNHIKLQPHDYYYYSTYYSRYYYHRDGDETVSEEREPVHAVEKKAEEKMKAEV
jgi:capsular exopolysaccharide synthesis family protein